MTGPVADADRWRRMKNAAASMERASRGPDADHWRKAKNTAARKERAARARISEIGRASCRERG